MVTQVCALLDCRNRSDISAVLFEACQLAPDVLRDEPHLVLNLISTILSPPHSSSARPNPGPKPNLHVLVLRCLDTLPISFWDGRLGDAEMGVIMEGINSLDDTVRRAVRPCILFWTRTVVETRPDSSAVEQDVARLAECLL